MSSPPPFYKLFQINVRNLSKQTIGLLEGELFIRLYEVLKENIRLHYKAYFNLINISYEKEDVMIESRFIHDLIIQILNSQEYTSSGIAYYTNAPEEIIYDLVLGRNIHPSFDLVRKILELHRATYPKLYHEAIIKIKCDLANYEKVE